MINGFITTLFFLFILSGCNSELADLSPITKLDPFITQLGATTKALNGANLGDDYCKGIVIDPKTEDIYCAGHTTGSLGSASSGSIDIILVKLNRKGELKWVRQYNSINNKDDFCANLVIKPDGLYCSGITYGLMNKEPVYRTDNGIKRSPSDTDTDALVIKFDRSGNILWSKQFGSSNDDDGSIMALGDSGNIYVAASTTGIIGTDFSGNPETRDNDNAGNPDSFISKLNNRGEILWIRQIGSTGFPVEADSFDTCRSLALDQSENVYCGGNTMGSLGELNGFNANNNTSDIFVWSVDKNGGHRFIKQIGAVTTSSPHIFDASKQDLNTTIAIDRAGNIYLGGRTNGPLVASTASLDSNALIIKLDKNLNVQWGIQTSNVGSENLTALSIDRQGNILTCGHVNSSVFGNHIGGNDLFLLKFSPEKEILEQTQFGSSEDELCNKISFDQYHNIYLSVHTKGDLGEANAKNGSTPSQDIAIYRLPPSGKL